MLLEFMDSRLGKIPIARLTIRRLGPESRLGGNPLLVLLLALPLLLLATVCAAAEEHQPPAAPSAATTTTTVGSVYGVVTSDDGTVYEGVRVVLETGGDVDPPPMTQETSASGAFDFTGVPAGPFKLTVSSNGFVTQEVSGVLQAGGVFDTRAIVLPVAAWAPQSPAVQSLGPCAR